MQLRRVLLLALVLALLVPPAAAAAQPEPPRFIDVYLHYDGTADGRVYSLRTESSFSSEIRDDYHWKYNWSIVAQLDLTKSPGVYEGRGVGNLSGLATGGGNSTWSSQDMRREVDWACTTRYVADALDVFARVVLDADGTMVFNATFPPMPNGTNEKPCYSHIMENGKESTTEPMPLDAGLLQAGLEVRASDRAAREVVAIVEKGYLRRPEASSWTLPVTYAQAYVGDHCAMKNRAMTGNSGSCAVKGVLLASLVPEPCPRIEREHLAAIAAMKAQPKPSNDSSESQLRAYAVAVRPLIQRVTGLERQWELSGCAGEISGNGPAEVRAIYEFLRDQLARRVSTLSMQGVSDLLAAERALQLQGADSGGDVITGAAARQAQLGYGPPADVMEVRVHSPVSLHAYSGRGGHVGVNGTSIPGASYEGHPGAEQTLRLPAGALYIIEVEQLGEGRYRLMTSANASAGEGFSGTSVPGRIARLAYSFEPTEEGGEWWPMPLTSAPAPTPTAVADARSDTGTDAVADPGGNDAPGTGAFAAVLALVAIALAARRGSG